MVARHHADTEPIGRADGSYFRVEKLTSQR